MAAEDNSKEEKPIHYEGGMPIFSPAPKNKDAEERERQKAEQSHKTKELSLQGRILWTQIGLVLFGLIGSGVSIWQANVAQQAADTSDKAILIAQRTERESRLTNENQYKISQRNLQVTIENFQKQQRPYIAQFTETNEVIPGYPVIRDIPEMPGKVQILWSWRMKNYGLTPAVDLLSVQYFKIQNGKYILSYRVDGRPNKNPSTFAHGYAAPGEDFYNTTKSNPMTRQEAERILSLGSSFTIKVRVDYKDLMGTSYSTQLCLVKPGAFAVGYCGDGYIH